MMRKRTLPKTVPPAFLFLALWSLFWALITGPAEAQPNITSPIDLRLHVFPGDAQAVLLSPRLHTDVELRHRTDGDGWRIYAGLPAGAVIELRAPGYLPRLIVLPGNGLAGVATVTVEERLLPAGGPLTALSEGGTGSSPKSAVFIAPDRVAVPLLRDDGIDLFEIGRDRWGDVRFVPAGRLSPPPQWAQREGFVEALVVRDGTELWVSQMTTGSVHRFSLPDGDWLSVHSSGGTWPKVLAGGRMDQTVWVSNWNDRSVAELDARSGHLLQTISLPGQPRGLFYDGESDNLWVCLFSSGQVLRLGNGEILETWGRSAGAARHIVSRPGSPLVYYSDMYHGTVCIVDSRERRELVSRRIGSNINTIVLDPEGRYLYVSERGRNNPESYLLPGPEFGRIFVLDARTLSTIQTLYGRNQPTGLAVSPDGRFVVATDFLDDNITLYRVE